MKLKILGSSSSGNCYFLESETEVLILECGVPVREIKKALDWNFKKVVGCLVTHSHNDHSKSIKDLQTFGVKVYALPETFESKNIDSPFSVPIEVGEFYAMGGFQVFPLPARHDVPIVCFLIYHRDFGNLMFATDTYIIPIEMRGVRNWMIEANYDKDKLAQDVEDCKTNSYLAQRVVKSHMSIGKTLEAVKASGIESVKNIVLIHLSDSNSDMNIFKNRMQELTGCHVWVAEKGLEINL